MDLYRDRGQGLSAANSLTLADFRRDLHDRSPRTLQSYTESLCQLAAFHHGADLLTMGKAEVLAYLIDVRETRSAATEAVRFRALRRFYNWAVAEELIDKSPLRGVGTPQVESKEIPVPPAELIRSLLRVCDGRGHDARRDTAIIRLACEPGGPRLAELAGIRVADLDMVADQVSVLGKGSRWRTIPFSATTGKALSRYLRVRAGHPLAGSPGLWLGARGQALSGSGIAQMLRRRCREAGVPRVHPHQLRHFAADVWFSHDGDLQDSLTLFGWRGLQMPTRYASANAAQRAADAHRRKALGDLL